MLTRKSKVHMVLSVGEHEAGKSYRLPKALADQYIVKGYAEGNLSRAYSDEERQLLMGPTQVITIGD